ALSFCLLFLLCIIYYTLIPITTIFFLSLHDAFPILYFKKKWLFCSYIILLGIILALLSIFQVIMLQIIIDTAVGNLTIGFLKIIMIVCLYVIMNYLFNLLYKRNLYKITTDAIAHIKNKLIDSFLIEKNIESQNLT